MNVNLWSITSGCSKHCVEKDSEALSELSKEGNGGQLRCLGRRQEKGGAVRVSYRRHPLQEQVPIFLSPDLCQGSPKPRPLLIRHRVSSAAREGERGAFPLPQDTCGNPSSWCLVLLSRKMLKEGMGRKGPRTARSPGLFLWLHRQDGHPQLEHMHQLLVNRDNVDFVPETWPQTLLTEALSGATIKHLNSPKGPANN